MRRSRRCKSLRLLEAAPDRVASSGSIQEQAPELAALGTGGIMTGIAKPTGSLPTLRITATGLQARGPFAETQRRYLHPDPAAIDRLHALLQRHQVGVVAHFYMDPRLQGVLTACRWPHIFISDSLAMADAAIRMVQAGMRAIVVLGVDFMSENVRAMVDAAGFGEVEVYRVASDPIGCSLAEAALAPEYGAFVAEAAATPRSLHVVYINTSLLTKARAQAVVPTITCTSSNVVRTVLAAFAQIPDLTLWYGPDTYMGRNLRAMFTRYAELPDDEIRALHPAHDRASMRRVLAGLHVFDQGTCVVHHMFGREVVEQVRRDYPGALYTAHLEVPGEMFELASEARRRGRGAVGSTSDILRFVNARVEAAINASESGTLRFVLGTEAGMITPIVRDVQRRLAERPRPDLAIDIVFPVSTDAIAVSGEAPGTDLPIVPGVAAGEGCSTTGGCATCAYMKMNNLDALFSLLRALPDRTGALHPFRPRAYTEQVAGRPAAEVGSRPILHMRDFQRLGRLSDELVARIRGG